MLTQQRWTLRLGLILALLVAALPAGLPALAQDGTDLQYGDQISGEITAAAPEVPYTFEGSAGDMITIRMQATAEGLDSFLALVGPDGGEPLVTDDDTAGNLNSLIGPYSLPADGTYTIIATRFMRLEGSSVGPFTLSLSLAQVTPLTVNETVSVELNDAAPQMFFSFTGQAGEMYSIEARVSPESTTDLRVDVRDPSNGYLNQGYSPAGGVALIDPLVLPVDGVYMVIVAAQPQGGMEIASNIALGTALTLRPIESEPIAFDEAVSGQADDDTPATHYVFTASRGDLLRLAGMRDGDSQAYEVLLINPSGNQFYGAVTAYDNPDGFTIDPLVLDQDGQYMILVRRFDDTGQGVAGRTSQYTLTLGRTETPLLALGEEVSGAFDDPTVYEQVYRYEGSAGEAVRVVLRSLDDTYAPNLDLQGPPMDDAANMGGGGGGAGSFVMNLNSGVPATMRYEVTLPGDGVYLFRVRNGMYAGPLAADGTATSSGTFGLTIEAVE